MKRMQVPLTVAIVVTLVQASAAQPVALKPENRIGVVNIGRVFMQYEKAKAFKLVMEKTLQPFKDKAEKLKAQITQLQTVVSDPTTDRLSKTKAEEALIDGKRKLEDLDRQARAMIGKKQEVHLVLLYKEVCAAVKEHADSHGILLVLAHGEPEGDVFTFVNINRKLTGMDAGSTVPLYVNPTCDISEQVVELLNDALKKERDATRRNAVRPSKDAR